MSRRRSLAVTLLLAAVGVWIVAALALTTMEESALRRMLGIVSIAWLAVGGLSSAFLAIKNSYEVCPSCDKPLFAGGLFSGYRNPANHQCASCGKTLR